MTGQELIDYITNNCDLANDVLLKDGNGNLFDVILNVSTDIKRDPYDGDFDKNVNVIELYSNVTITEQ